MNTANNELADTVQVMGHC